MARKPKKHEHVNHERWLVSYADFITLLFAFFVVMFAVSQVDSKKMGRFVESVNVAFQLRGVFEPTDGSPLGRGGAGNSIVTPIVSDRPTFLDHGVSPEAAGKVYERIEERLARSGLTRYVTLRYDPRGVAVVLPEGMCFEAGAAALDPDALANVRAVARALEPEEGPIQIEAHTDDLPIYSTTHASSWELSAIRAGSIARVLQEAGIDPRRLSAAGLGGFRPLVENSNEVNRQANRRVDVVLITQGARATE